MSRLFVKNLPKYVTEERLKEHFSSQGTVTDVRIIKNKQTGESRQFGYIGFATEKEAKQARKYFNNTFVDTRRVEVHVAKPAGDASLAPWSRHSKGSSAYRREHPEEEREAEEQSGGLLTKKRKRDEPEESGPGARKKRRGKGVDIEKEHFMQLARPKSKRTLWGDESTAVVEKLRKGIEKEAEAGVVVKKSLVQSKKAGGEGVFLERKHIVFNDDDEDHDDDDLYEELPEAAAAAIAEEGSQTEDVEMEDAKEEGKKAAFDDTLSDMDYLKSLMKPSAAEKKDASEESGADSSSSDDDSSSSDNEESSQSGGSSSDDDSSSDGKKEADHESDEEEEDSSSEESSDSEAFEAETAGKSAAASAAEDTGRLFLRNLPFNTTEEDLTEAFRRFGELAEVHLPIDRKTKRGTGIAFILFMIPSDAVVAMNAMDKQFFKGRIIHVLPAAAPKVDSTAEAAAGEGALSSFKKKKEAQKKAMREDDTNWNTLFIRSDTVVGAMASKFGVEAGDILSADADNMAVRVALGETNIIQETKKFLQKEGVDLDVLRRQKDKKAKRSKTVILVKNLPHSTNKEELRALFSNYGELGRIVMPESRAMALVEYLQANEAKAAFSHLSYSRFHHVPLYLEWAPMMVFVRPPTEEEIANSRLAEEEEAEAKTSAGITVTKQTPLSMDDATDDLEAMDVPSLFVKNLSFDTTEDGLREFVEKRLAGRKVNIRSVRIAQKNTKGKVLSMGFGFVELGSKEQAVIAMKALQGKELDNHKIELKFSKANAKPGASASVSGKNKRKKSGAVSEKAQSNKLLVKNLAFQATRKELRELFSPYGQVESVRIPRKFDGTSRGYGFVEFLTKQEAKNAMEALTHTHLYGRHLVLDYAQDSKKSLDELRKKAAKDLTSEH